MEIGVIIADIHITYHAPIHYDDNIKVGVKTTKIGNKSVTGGTMCDGCRHGGNYGIGDSGDGHI